MTHPHQLHAAAALWSLRAALRHLAHHRTAVLIRHPQLGPVSTRPRSLAQLRQHDTLLRQERAERAAGSLRGLKPSAGAAAPISPGLVDLDLAVSAALTDATELVAHVHRGHPILAWSPVWAMVIRSVFLVSQDYRWTYLSATIPGTPPSICAEITRLLDDADTRVRAVCGLQPDHWPLPLPPTCPVCRQRRLRVQSSAPSSARWTLVCVNEACVCLGDGDPAAGDGCPCGMPTRAEGVRHIWAADSPLARSAFAGASIAGGKGMMAA